MNDSKSAEDGCESEHGDILKEGVNASDYIGKIIRKRRCFIGLVNNVITNGNNTCLLVHIIDGKGVGRDTEILLSYILDNQDGFTISK